MNDEPEMDNERDRSSAKRPFNPDGGEDEDDHLHDDQKPITGTSSHGDNVSDDDRHKTEKLTKAGRPIDPDAGSD